MEEDRRHKYSRAIKELNMYFDFFMKSYYNNINIDDQGDNDNNTKREKKKKKYHQ